MAAAAGPLPVRRPAPTAGADPRALLEAALTAQRSFMDLYGDQLEQLLSILVYLVPVQDAQEDVAGFWSQAVYSVIDLFNLYRTVLLRSPEALPVVASSSSSSGVVGGGGQQRRLVYTLAAFSLRALRSVQVLVEMRVVRTRNQQESLRACMLVESLKLVLKLVLCAQMPFSFYIDEDALEEVEPPKLRSGPARPPLMERPAGAAAGGEAFVGRRTGRALFGGGGGTLGGQLQSDVTQGRLLRVVVAEVLFHGRPLVQLFLLLRRGLRSWSAWGAALGLEWVSLVLLLPQLKPRPNTRAAALELAEVARRRKLLGWALLRSPLFDWALRRPCQALDGVWKRVPILNIFNILELALALQPFYFSTSGT